uniref:Uncharacterized protein n=1 Tax=Podarcis muralis TaxID=64176 RepID=A0A670KL58_PODMU
MWENSEGQVQKSRGPHLVGSCTVFEGVWLHGYGHDLFGSITLGQWFFQRISQLQLFQRISKVHLGESPSGILLIYSHCLLHILEASSGTLYHILMDLAAVENQDSNALIQDVKILAMSHNIPTRLFNQWYATAVEVPVTLEDVTQTQTTEEVITECLTLNLKLGVYLATLKVGNKGLSDCLHTVVPELLMPAETIQYLCKAKECLSPEEFLKIYNNPLQPKMDSASWPSGDLNPGLQHSNR